MLKVLYAGSPEASAKTLEYLIQNSSSNDFEICGVLTNPMSVQGRHKTPVPTSVHVTAEKYNIPVFTPEHLDSELRNEISKLNPDILVCFAYGHIFGPKFLSLFKFGGINLHPSDLPEYRGCTPVNAAILDLKEKTAFSIQKVSLKMDEGNILSKKEIILTKKENCVSLLTEAALWGAEEFSSILQNVSKDQKIPEGIPQTGEASYTKIIKKEDAKIDWNKKACQIDAMVRAYYSDPVCWTIFNQETIKIHEGFPLSLEEAFNFAPELKNSNEECGKVCAFVKSKGIFVKSCDGFYVITVLQKQGKNQMDYKSFINGARDFVGSILK